MKMTTTTMTTLLSAALLAAGAAGAALAAPAKRPSKGKSTVAGVRTVFIQSGANPLVALRVFFQVGSVDDPAGKEGLALLTSQMLGKGGSKARTYAEVLDALYPLAAQIHVYGDKESIVFEGTVHRDNLAKFADLLADQVLAPRFADDDFTRNRQDALDYVTKTLRGNADEDLGKQAMATLMFYKHPYGTPSQGTVAGLNAITLEDVRKLYASRFARDRLVVGVAGGYPDGFAETFAKRFAVLPAKAPALTKLPPVPVPRRNRLIVVEKDARADAISIGRPLNVTRKDPDFYPLTVARSYLGEHRTFNGVLMIRLREIRGLNYGDYGYIENFIQDGWTTFPLPNIARRQPHFEIWLRPVPPHNSLFALRAALYETDKLIREGIPQAGFEATKKFLENYSNLWAQDASRRLGFAIDAVVTGKDMIKELQARLPKMTKAEVDAAVRKHLGVDGLTIAIVTEKGQSVADTLMSGAPTGISYDTAGTPADVVAEDDLIKRFPLPIEKENVRIYPVDKMF
ncbi:MAG TPA: pitrilysin family protein, partial [Polyangia bacterium]|nr:pitrilysin family protein [Polyangia bacterium]